ncbi:RNA polymerase-binding protein DksA [Rubrivivax rivuli]|uniref:RNA polymerase-binding protein DksA n=1 Tax=Rubrivivax rivuli TaxID=1862385 RepID=UPI001FDF5980|nr:RNA polymerase-binding protein DksA [Rubrivivax rivuli]
MSKPPAKTAAASKAKTAGASPEAPKQAAKAAAKPAAKAPAKVAEKPVEKPAAKAAAKPDAKAAAKPAAKATPAPAPAPLPTPAPAPAPALVKAPAPKSAAQKAAAKAAPQNQLPTPAPAQAVNRFTDRFAPAAPAARQMTETADLPKNARQRDPKLANAWKTKPGRELTVDELLAMPDSEYMNDKQLDFFRAQLQKQKDDLLSNAGETTEHLREDTSIVPDPADRATIEEEHALELRTRDRERKLLKKIAQSLSRLDTGEYGYCDETGEPIGLQRLLARPTATLSLEAQQRRELKQKMFGD